MKHRTDSDRKLPSPACGRGAGGEGKVARKRAKHLRANQTEAEERLWYFLRDRRFMDLKFRRQRPVGRYIVDFVCLSPGLIVEIDGGQHGEQAGYDRRRDQWLRSRGFRVVRYWNNQVLGETEAVLEDLRQVVVALIPGPSPGLGRGEI